jgi:KaiC/GvpD/RAD55 family RecA-like ATPase
MIIAQRIDNELSKLPEGWIVLLETSAENSTEVAMTSLKLLTKRKYKGIIISANRPYKNLMQVYEQNGIKTKNIYVIDCISKSYGSVVKDKRVEYVDNVASLTDLSMAVNHMIQEVEGEKFLFIDSITTVLIHNKKDVFVRFIHAILTKMRVHKISGILIALETETDQNIKEEIVQLCDKVVKI